MIVKSIERLMETMNEIEQNKEAMEKATRAFYESQMEFVRARREWEDYVAVNVSNGNIVGKNDAARAGMAMEMEPELYMKFVVASDELSEHELNLQLAKIADKAVGRKIAVSAIFSGYHPQALDT